MRSVCWGCLYESFKSMVVVMDEGHKMTNQTPLDISKYDDDNADEVYQLEIFKEEDLGEPNPKFARSEDCDLDEAIRKHKGYIRDLKVKDPSKLEKVIAELEREKQCRKRKKELEQYKKEPEAPTKDLRIGRDDRETPASPFPERNVHGNPGKTDGAGRGNRSPSSHCWGSSDEVQILNAKEGAQFFPCRISPSTPGSRVDGGRNKVTAFSGPRDGPTTRLRGRRESRPCINCGKSNPRSVLVGKNGENYDLCLSCQDLLLSNDSSPEESPKRSRPLSGLERQSNAGKRVMQGGQQSLDKVVELSDEEEGCTPDSFAEVRVPNQTNVYGTRSRHASSRVRANIAYPSRGDPEAIEVAYDDLRRLDPLEFLNDTVIDFYIKYMQRPENLTEEQKDKFYFFNSFFYKKLSEIAYGPNKKQTPDLSKLRKWTKTNIFKKEYLFVPIHDKWHWSLAIVCHPGAIGEDTGSQRCILHLDSMSPGHKSNWVFKLLRTYLLEEWKHRAVEDRVSCAEMLNLDAFETKKIPVPQQENESDCGLFLLHYMERFIKDAPPTFKISDLNQGKLFGKNWFAPSRASGLRGDIQQLLENMFKDEALQSGAQMEALMLQRGEEQEPAVGDGQPVNGVVAQDEHDMEIAEEGSRPGQPLATPLVQEMDVEDTRLANGGGSPGSLPHEDKHTSSISLEAESPKPDEDLKDETNLCADTLSNLSTDLLLPTSPKPQQPLDLDAMDEDQRATSANETYEDKETNEVQQLNGVGKDLSADARLVVDLDIEKQADEAARKAVADRMASNHDVISLD